MKSTPTALETAPPSSPNRARSAGRPHARFAQTTAAALDYEAQTVGFGLELRVTDAPREGASQGDAFNQPGPLSEFATVLVAVGDVNEAPYWPTLMTCAAPASDNVYASAPATLDTAAARFVACFYVPENSAPGVFSPQAVLPAADPDVFWASSHPQPAFGQRRRLRFGEGIDGFDHQAAISSRCPSLLASQSCALLASGPKTF
jgi:hypothetical protein